MRKRGWTVWLCIAAAAALAGCGGCVSQGDDGTFVDPSRYEPPAWEKVQ